MHRQASHHAQTSQAVTSMPVRSNRLSDGEHLISSATNYGTCVGRGAGSNGESQIGREMKFGSLRKETMRTFKRIFLTLAGDCSVRLLCRGSLAGFPQNDIAAQKPLVWYKLNEWAGGSIAVNAGSIRGPR